MKVAVVSGAIANKSLNGGEAWVRLSWARALQRLGFATYFVEHIGRGHCTSFNGELTDFHESANLSYFREVTDRFGLAGKAGLIYEQGREFFGLGMNDLRELSASADVLINISGHLPVELLESLSCRKVWVDIDPGFTQCWHAAGDAGALVAGHDFYFTIGENIGTRQCDIPTGGLEWRHTRQPVVLDDWPVAPATDRQRFTTIASWRGSFGQLQYQGRTFGSKVHEFRKFIELPARAKQPFEIALNIHPGDQKDLDLLQRWGWRIINPSDVASHPADFRQYVQNSAAEFSVAQGIYVETNSGWFSDRTVRYLASGKPALVQETGFSQNLPVGEGLVAFRTLDEAIAGARSIATNYDQHCAAARKVAEAYFDSDKILIRMLEEIGVAP